MISLMDSFSVPTPEEKVDFSSWSDHGQGAKHAPFCERRHRTSRGVQRLHAFTANRELLSAVLTFQLATGSPSPKYCA